MKTYDEIAKAMKDETVSEKLSYITSLTDTKVLLDIVNGKINAVELAKWAIANRGLGKTGEWVGFDNAKKIWSGK
jgi:hypothetical protein